MVEALLGRKIGMTQIFDDAGRFVPVTVLEVGPCAVTQVKTVQRDGVSAVQVGFEDAKRKNVTQPLLGHFAEAGVAPKRFLQDVAVDEGEEPELGQELTVAEFEGVGHVDVVGTSRGRGFAGVVRRHGFHASPATHGGRFGRHAGSIGCSAFPGRVIKGRRMPGQMGARRVTVRNLQVVEVDPERDLIIVKGSVPGPKGGLVLVRKARRAPVGAGA